MTTGKDEGTVNTSAEMSTVQCVPNQLPKSNNTKKERKRPAHKLLKANRAKFRKLACDGPSCVCASCHKLCYASHGTFSKDGNGVLGCIKQDVAAKSLVVLHQMSIIFEVQKISGTAFENSMEVSNVLKELKGCNSLEEGLISRVTPFMKLVVLPRRRQRAIKVQVIIFSIPMKNTVDQLPRPADDNGIVYVQEADGGLYNGENVLAQSNVEELAETAATLLEDDNDANGAIS